MMSKVLDGCRVGLLTWGVLVSPAYAFSPPPLDFATHLAQRFCPILILHSQEKYFPADPAAILFQLDLMQQIPGQKNPQKIFSVTPERVADLLAPSFQDQQHFVSLIGKEDLFPGDTPKPFGSETRQEERLALSVRSQLGTSNRSYLNSSLYVNVVKTSETNYVLQYMPFYPYNGPAFLQFGQHRGDWEHFDVYVSCLSEEDSACQVTKVFFGYHQGSKHGEWATPAELKFLNLDGHSDRFVSLLAKYGHATYPYRIMSTPNGLFDRTDNKGAIWVPKVHVVALQGNVLEAYSFMRFQGPWGDTVSAPDAPIVQAWWRKSQVQVVKRALLPVSQTRRLGNKSKLGSMRPFAPRATRWRLVEDSLAQEGTKVDLCGAKEFFSPEGVKKAVEVGRIYSVSELGGLDRFFICHADLKHTQRDIYFELLEHFEP